MNLFATEKTKGIKSQIANLVSIAKSDGNFSVAEKKLVFEIGEKNGISKDRIKEIIRTEDPIKFKTPDNDSLRFDRVYEIVQMMLADGVSEDDDKMNVGVELAEKLGVRKAVAGVLVRKLLSGMKNEKTKEELKEACADFLNYAHTN